MYFTGSNLFSQWYGCNDSVIDEFRRFPEGNKTGCNLYLKDAKCVHIGWSHNIFEYQNRYYISGGFEKKVESINPPSECGDCSNIAIVSDDYRIVIVSKDTSTFWLMNLEDKAIKKVRINTEIPVEQATKKLKSDDSIIKCVGANESLIFLTSKKLVYQGLLPSLVDTSHCLGEVIDIQCGYEHYVLLTDAGRVYSWGNGRRLQLGHGDVNTLELPTEVEALSGIKITKIAAGGWHSLALSEFGDLYAWGWNDTGQLGVKANSNTELLKSYSQPTFVDLFDEDGEEVTENVIDISCGSRHSAILLEDKSIWTTGNNKYGQLGISRNKQTVVQLFKKAFHHKSALRLMCGPWSTVVI